MHQSNKTVNVLLSAELEKVYGQINLQVAFQNRTLRISYLIDNTNTIRSIGIILLSDIPFKVLRQDIWDQIVKGQMIGKTLLCNGYNFIKEQHGVFPADISLNSFGNKNSISIAYISNVYAEKGGKTDFLGYLCEIVSKSPSELNGINLYTSRESEELRARFEKLIKIHL